MTEGQIGLFGEETESPEKERKSRKSKDDGDESGEIVRTVFREGDRIESDDRPGKKGTVIMVSLVTSLLRVMWDGEEKPDFTERSRARRAER